MQTFGNLPHIHSPPRLPPFNFLRSLCEQTKVFGCCMMCAGGICCGACYSLVMNREDRERTVQLCKHWLSCKKSDTAGSNPTDDAAAAMGLLSPSASPPVNAAAALNLHPS